MSKTINEILEFLYINVSIENPHLLLSVSENKFPLVCTWNESNTQETIESLEKMNHWILPDDYKQFLKTHNGGRLFYNVEFGGGIELLSLSQISSISSLYEQISLLNRHC